MTNKTIEKLEIILITYNRKSYLQKTFNQIFAENSPIKDFPITILNNKSTDGTNELIEEYKQKFPNITHIIHNRNIGGNANIMRAYEIASKEYLWILCDDDEFDFSSWDDVEQAITEEYDAIVVANYVNPKKNIAQLTAQLTFVPAGIYKTSNITDTIMINSSYNISNMFPQLSLVCHLINHNKKFKILDNHIVKMIMNYDDVSYSRGMDSDKHPHLANMIWATGFIDAIQVIKDKKNRDFIMNNLEFEDKSKPLDVGNLFFVNKLYHNNSSYNLFKFYANLDNLQKIKFNFAKFLRNIFYIDKEPKFYRVKLFIVKFKIKHEKIDKLIVGK